MHDTAMMDPKPKSRKAKGQEPCQPEPPGAPGPEDANAQTDPAAEQPSPLLGPSPCVGLPVQFCMAPGQVVPAVLQRKSITGAGWDLKVSISGAMTLVPRANIPHSDTPKPGHWNHLPIWNEFTGLTK